MYHGFFSYGTEKKLGGAAWARDLILEGDAAMADALHCGAPLLCSNQR